MAVVMMTMTMMMPMAVVPVMAVAVASTVTVPAVPAVAAMPAVTVTASEGLARDGQGSGGQRQSSDRSGNDLLDLRHGRLLLGRARIALR